MPLPLLPLALLGFGLLLGLANTKGANAIGQIPRSVKVTRRFAIIYITTAAEYAKRAAQAPALGQSVANFASLKDAQAKLASMGLGPLTPDWTPQGSYPPGTVFAIIYREMDPATVGTTVTLNADDPQGISYQAWGAS